MDGIDLLVGGPYKEDGVHVICKVLDLGGEVGVVVDPGGDSEGLGKALHGLVSCVAAVEAEEVLLEGTTVDGGHGVQLLLFRH